MKKLIALGLVALTTFVGSAHAATVECKNIYRLSGKKNVIGGILYKSSNVHGGRGMTFIVQNKNEKDSQIVAREVRDIKCNKIAKFGLWREKASAHRFPYCPYGTRYYMEKTPNASGFTPKQMYKKALKGGSTAILVKLKDLKNEKDRWMLVKNPLASREGSVTNYPNGYCNH